jgi:hypothetical protein
VFEKTRRVGQVFDSEFFAILQICADALSSPIVVQTFDTRSEDLIFKSISAPGKICPERPSDDIFSLSNTSQFE